MKYLLMVLLMAMVSETLYGQLTTTVLKKNVKKMVPVTLKAQAENNINICWKQNEFKLGTSKTQVLAWNKDIFYKEYEKGWIITDGNYTFPVTGFILQKFLATGGISMNGVPAEDESNKRLGNTNLLSQVFTGTCFWGCGITVYKVERAFHDYLKREFSLKNNVDYLCPLGDMKSFQLNTMGKVLLFSNRILSWDGKSPVIDLDMNDKIVKKWKEVGFLNSKLGCPQKLEIVNAQNSTAVLSRSLKFDWGAITHTYNVPGIGDVIAVNYLNL